uniref:Uncharacterized protein n=1 Tax=Ditylenchus dipsaci TaxID=166011 RepID=A0A915EIX8_9BILA
MMQHPHFCLQWPNSNKNGVIIEEGPPVIAGSGVDISVAICIHSSYSVTKMAMPLLIAVWALLRRSCIQASRHEPRSANNIRRRGSRRASSAQEQQTEVPGNRPTTLSKRPRKSEGSKGLQIYCQWPMHYEDDKESSAAKTVHYHKRSSSLF